MSSAIASPATPPRRVAVVTLGCARNDVDAEELAGRLASEGWQLVQETEDADVTLVNTCGFIEAAKKDSIDAVLEVADRKPAGGSVVAVGCMAERYGNELAQALPEADAVLSFDDYDDISARLVEIVNGKQHVAHAPRDRRTLLPLSPVARQAERTSASAPAASGSQPQVPATAPTSVRPPSSAAQAARHTAPAAGSSAGVSAANPPSPLSFSAPASGPRPMRLRLSDAPWAPLKLATGCDRRCSFCAIPAFRGAYLSRPPAEVLADARQLVESGVRELFLVSENSTSYGKDLGDIRALEKLLPELAKVGADRVRLSYLQPAEMRPGLIDVLAGTPGVAAYFDLSFQHSSASVLRRMRRFGDTDRFLDLIAAVRLRAPEAGIRSNVIVGFPGETDDDVAELQRFLIQARLDAVGVFGYSDEDGTEAVRLADKVSEAEIASRLDAVSRLAEELTSQRAEERIGQTVEVLVETVSAGEAEGRAAHQGPEVDGTTRVLVSGAAPAIGDVVRAHVVGCDGADLLAEAAG